MITTYKYADSVDSEISVMNMELNFLLEMYSNAQTFSKSETSKAAKRINELDNIQEPFTIDERNERGDANLKIINHSLYIDYITLHSFFVMAFSFFEYCIIRVANYIEYRSKSTKKIADMKSRTELVRCRKYLFEVHVMSSASHNSSLWSNMLIFQEIRNCIVHNHAHFPKSMNDQRRIEIVKFIEDLGGKTYRGLTFKIKEERFLVEFVILAKEYLDELFKEIIFLT